MQFKPATGKNLISDTTIDKNIFDPHTPSSSFAPAGTSKRNGQKSTAPPDAANSGHGQGNKIRSSSSLFSSLQRISSAK
ncbi:hypothetical protein Gorai_007341 [Gossypium raimondii]|nr:hypothetical protein [Gossypium raimondii]